MRSPDQPSNGYSFEWDDITAVVAFKRDCYVHDLICMAVADVNNTLEINEEIVGWDALILAMEKKLPGSIPAESWWPLVASPAFATNPTIVYSRN